MKSVKWMLLATVFCTSTLAFAAPATPEMIKQAYMWKMQQQIGAGYDLGVPMGTRKVVGIQCGNYSVGRTGGWLSTITQLSIDYVGWTTCRVYF